MSKRRQDPDAAVCCVSSERLTAEGTENRREDQRRLFLCVLGVPCGLIFPSSIGDNREAQRNQLLKEALIQRVEQFLLKLGGDFTFIGRQRRLRIGDEWYRVEKTRLFPDGRPPATITAIHLESR